MKQEIQLYALDPNFGTDTDREVLIEYRPFYSAERWLSHRFSVWNSWKAWFAVLIIVMFFVLNGPAMIVEKLKSVASIDKSTIEGAGHSIGGAINPAIEGLTSSGAAAATGALPQDPITSVVVLQAFAFLAVAGVLASMLSYMRRPTHLAVSDKGIAWEWRHMILGRGQLVPWSLVKSIDLEWPEGKTSPLNCMIKIKTEDDRVPMTIKYGGLASQEERQTFVESLERWAPEISKDAQLLDMLSTSDDESYTELWLRALSAPPERERLTPLLPKTSLQDGRFTIHGQLGVGGQGTAYEATEEDGSPVVLKEFILPVYVDINVRRQALDRMQNEVVMLKKLDHDRIVKLKDFFVEDHRGYLVLERIDGNSLRTVVAEDGAIEEGKVINLALQMCDMLEYLHGISPPVVHRDFTPDNLILRNDGVLKLVDFNVAQQKDQTVTSTVVGKQSYLPPEQFRGKPTTRSDIYAMGATIYFLLTGEDPEPITMSYPRQKDESVSEALDFIVAKATTLDENARHPDIEELKKELIEMAGGTPVESGAHKPQLESQTDASDDSESSDKEQSSDSTNETQVSQP